MNITQQEALELFEYKDGCLFWKVSPVARIKAGTRAGTLRQDGYRGITIKNKKYLEHRIIYLMHYDLKDKDLIDHIDNNPLNNNIENLRIATISQNNSNVKRNRANTSGAKGVYLQGNKYIVRIWFNGTNKCLGTFEDFELAELVAIEARNKYHGEFANHG